MKNSDLIASLKGGLLISCQAKEGDPTYSADMMVAFAKSAQLGGAAGIRANGPTFIRAIKQQVDLPLLGIQKVTAPVGRVVITSSVEDAKAIVAAGADMIAADVTDYWRSGNLSGMEFLRALKKELDVPVVAEVEYLEEGLAAAENGADMISTTLAVDHMPKYVPDFKLLEELVRRTNVPILMEGNIWSPEDLVRCFELGAHCVVIGSVVTRPWQVVERYTKSIERYSHGNT